VAVGARDGFEEHEKATGEEVEQNMLCKVDATKMDHASQQLGRGVTMNLVLSPMYNSQMRRFLQQLQARRVRWCT
jgi:hypothetical protein